MNEQERPDGMGLVSKYRQDLLSPPQVLKQAPSYLFDLYMKARIALDNYHASLLEEKATEDSIGRPRPEKEVRIPRQAHQ